MSKVKVIPCSGIGKVFGLMARESALKVTNELKPNETETVCLAHIVTGDEDSKSKIEGFPCITIDGCPKLCAAKNAELAGGIVKMQYRTVDEMRNHRGVDAGTATALTPDGWKVVDELCEKICEKVDDILKEEK
ncbi:DGC domain-containing protein [Caloramator quimbayensis]|uniref:DGC domain-containing protein n=1 Tax=Caloramator quimbayensis TaxID=1147123 RepID=A0A1T4WWZ4_9CLOT|nr:putative zinc-binding protein [Caloramator quimbayensis]SKA81161.1 DGC domain-containing protein [Caloramator quimbayensis]